MLSMCSRRISRSPLKEKQELIEVDPAPVSKELKKRWSYFIRKVYETDPLTCPKYQGEMRIIGFIDQPDRILSLQNGVQGHRAFSDDRLSLWNADRHGAVTGNLSSRRLKLESKFLSLSLYETGRCKNLIPR